MPAAPIPEDEEDRLKALERYAILDTGAEDQFDRITRLAAGMVGAPIALVSLVDEARQWFKARVGLDVDQTHRDLAFCSHAILQDDLFIIPDASRDPRFKDNPLVTGDPSIRFYAGAPLRTHDGFKLGTLCVIDRTPRTLEPAAEKVLADLSALVVDELELRIAGRRALAEIEARRSAESEMLRLAAEAEQARRLAEEALAARSLFLATMTHELRTPLNAVIGYAELMQMVMAEAGRDTLMEYTENIRSSGTYLLELINDVLDISRVEAGKIEIEPRPLDLREEAQRSLRMVKGLAYERRVRLVLADGPWPAVEADARAVKQILLNLLSNAIKFSPAGRSVTLAARPLAARPLGDRPPGDRPPGDRPPGDRPPGDRPPGDRVEMEVADQGQGMTAADLARIGQPYEQAGTAEDRRKGTGLGLALCRILVERHGGTLRIDSRPGEGTVIRFDLPATTRPPDPGLDLCGKSRQP